MKSRILSVATVVTVVFSIPAHGNARTGRPAMPQPLERITSAELTTSGVHGTGCSWALRGERGSRLVMIGDRALVKLAGRLVILEPGRGARDMFPFTHDRWNGPHGDVVITVRKVGSARRIGTETLGSQTDVVLVQAGRRTLLHGIMECGS